MSCLLFALVGCVACIAPGDGAARQSEAGLRNEGPQQGDPQQPDLQELVDDDLRRRDRPSQKLDTTESGYAGWLLLDWGGGRERLEDLGLRIEMLSTTDGSVALAGGVDPGEAVARSLLDLTFSYETEPLLGWRGGTLHAGLQWITGVVWSDPFAPGDDHLGLGLSHAGLSRAAGAGFTEEDETAVEMFYGFELLPWVRVKPDLQYVIHPGGDAALDNAWIATLRLTFSL